jgi:hypothetical protein
MTAAAPAGPGFNQIQASLATKMEIYCTSFSDPHDECLFVLRDKNDRVLAEQRINGY